MLTLDKTVNTGQFFAKTCLRKLMSKKLMIPRFLKILTFTLMTALTLTAGGVRAGQDFSSTTLAANTDPENTKRNVRDRDGRNVTPEKQKETSGDVEITRAIRKAIVDRESLSTDAHNAKIITRNGVVTLRGPVKNSAEKAELQSIAKKIRGVKKIDNQLEPKTP